MRYRFARAYLNRFGIEMYANNKQILTPAASHYKNVFDKANVGFWVGGEEASTDRKITILTTMQQIEDVGFGLASVKPKYKFRKRQRVQYVLAKLGQKNVDYLSGMPSSAPYTVEYDLANKQLRLIGPNAGPVGVGKWVKIVQKRKRVVAPTFRTPLDKIRSKDKIMRDFRHSMFRTKKKEFIKIVDLPIVRTDANEIVCVSKALKDEPRFGIFGGSGTGKSTAKHSLIDRAFHYWGVRPVLMNDSQVETTEYCTPNIGDEVALNNLHESPKPLPTVYLHPNTETTDKIVHEKEGISYKMTLPYKEIITNCHLYLDELKGSAKYFNHKKDDLLNIPEPITIEKIMDVFKGVTEEEKNQVVNKLTGESGGLEIQKPPLGSIRKVQHLMQELKGEQIMDVWTDIPSTWEVKLGNGEVYETNPVTACVIAGLVPVMVTQDLLQRDYFSKVFQYYATDLFNKNDLPALRNSRIWLDIDELYDITGKGKKKTLAADSIRMIQTKGRQRGIGTLVSTQNYTKVPDLIVSNCDHLIVLKTTEAPEIRSDYSALTSSDVKRIQKLDVFECMAYTDKHFVVYDSDGNKEKKKGPIFGKCLPPLSTHLPPQGKKQK